MVNTVALCPTCKQPIPSTGNKRVCCKCGVVIGKHHKWYFNADSRPQHRDCAHPDAYPTAANAPQIQEALL